MNLLRGMGIEVSTDAKEGQKVLDMVNGNVRMMGSRVENRKKRIASELQGMELTEEQKDTLLVCSLGKRTIYHLVLLIKKVRFVQLLCAKVVKIKLVQNTVY